jgi:hypothetical protein
VSKKKRVDVHIQLQPEMYEIVKNRSNDRTITIRQWLIEAILKKLKEEEKYF